jgi:hypothetical protein
MLSILNFFTLMIFIIKPSSHYPRTHCSDIPVFHHSNCERSELRAAQSKEKGATNEQN